MARGFESKDVEFQQAEAARTPSRSRALTAEERAVASQRRSLELAIAKARAERQAASHPQHRRMLDEALRALEAELRLLA
jgi:RNA polymerase-interacting CarD/CdnL/TRCF family regulator